MIPILYGGQGYKEDPGGAALHSQPGGQLEGVGLEDQGFPGAKVCLEADLSPARLHDLQLLPAPDKQSAQTAQVTCGQECINNKSCLHININIVFAPSIV